MHRDFGAELKECSGEDDHVYLLVVYPTKVTLSKLLNCLEGVSAGCCARRGRKITGRYKDGVLWSPSYFAGLCGGAPLTVIADSIRNQRKAAPPPRPEGRGLRRGN